jgi:hypothetical protein
MQHNSGEKALLHRRFGQDRLTESIVALSLFLVLAGSESDWAVKG